MKLPAEGTQKRDQMVKHYARLVQRDVCYCTNCQPFDGGEVVWVSGEKTDLEDVLDDYDVPEELRDEVASQLKCRNCSTELERGATVGLDDSPSREFYRHQPREIEFTEFLVDLLRRNPEFSDTQTEARVSDGMIADLTTVMRRDRRPLRILIECRISASFTELGLHQTIAQIQRYRDQTKFDAYVLAFPGRISSVQRSLLERQDIQCWDIDYITTTFPEQIKQSGSSYYKHLLLHFLSAVVKPAELVLLDRLHACRPGKNDWIEYQRLVGQILERLFCPPLLPPLSESADNPGINRRDFILPNYADGGFWRFLRDLYRADYIVVDAKNYTSSVGKNQVLQIANWSAPGSMDNRIDGCTMKPEVTFEHRKEATQSLYA
jgi:hypothetical protein